MRVTACATSVLLVSALFSTPGLGQDTGQISPTQRNDTFATRRAWSKGGIGIVTTSLYIVVKSSKNDRNELIVKPTQEIEERWKGKSLNQNEVVFVYGNKVWSPASLPDRFDLSKAVVVSFEGDKIRFFDFQTMSGGYYERISQ